MHDLACVVHLHSTYSDGTGHGPGDRPGRRGAPRPTWCCSPTTTRSRPSDSGEEGWYGDVLLLVGEEVSPRGRNHYLAFGIDEEIDHRPLDAAGICAAVRAAGGFGFAAHPFSRRAPSASSAPAGMPFDALDCDALHGIELWSFVNDTGEAVASIPEMARFLVAPGRALDHPPARNMRAWDELCRTRRVVAIGGLDAHQFGKRIGPVVPLRLMGYRRSFRYIRTHVLCERAHRRARARREAVYDALREGRCYIAVDSIAPARGFAFEADDLPMGAEAPAGPPDACGRARRATRGCGCCATAREIADRDRPLARGRGRGAGRLPRRGAAALQGPRAHLDPVQPDLPARVARR